MSYLRHILLTVSYLTQSAQHNRTLPSMSYLMRISAYSELPHLPLTFRIVWHTMSYLMDITFTVRYLTHIITPYSALSHTYHHTSQ